jgi:hypothetical protein
MKSNAPLNFGVLNFPVLQKVGWLTAAALGSVHTLNFPNLEHTNSLRIYSSATLHTINAPKMQSLGLMQLSHLPSLRTIPSFAAALKGLVGAIDLWNTSLIDVSFPNIEVLSILSIWGNRNLTTLNFPSLTLITELHDRGGGNVLVSDNNPDFILSLPRLTTVTGDVQLSGLGGIKIPELRVIGKNPRSIRGPGSLFIGSDNNDWRFYCVNCRPTYLSGFSTPKLKKVEGRVSFDNSPELSNINLPVLR